MSSGGPVRPWKARVGPRLAAALGGALPALAFPEANVWWVAYVGFVPLLVLLRTASSRREASTRAWLAGSSFFLAVHHWLLPKVGPFAVPLAAALGLLWIPWGRLAWRLLGRPLRPGAVLGAMVVVPSAWVAAELVRSWEHLGGPWALLGTSQWSTGPVLDLASVTGVWGLSFLAMAVNVALSAVVDPEAVPRARAAAVLGAGLLVGSTVVYGAIRAGPESSGSVVVAGVQPGVVHRPEPRFRAHEAATLPLAASRPELVVWAESSVGFDLGAHPGHEERLLQLSRAVGADLLVNVDARRGRGGIYKTSLMVGPDGRRDRYDKMRLVPFGEYVPLRPLFAWVSAVTDATTEDRRRGPRLSLLSSGGLQVGPLVCFESAFPDLSRQLAGRGAQVIVVQAATTTFQGSWAQGQHASLAAVRAVESGRPVVHASVSGVSAVFDAAGRRLAWVPADRRGSYSAVVPVTTGRTPYVRFGDWFPYGCLMVVAGVLLGPAARRRGLWPASRNGPGSPRQTARPM